jgi:hypothetical protein
LILNLATGSITPQYHVVFDDRYSTVPSIGSDDEPPSDWDDLCLDSSLYVPADTAPDAPQHLHDDWLTEVEREVKHREIQRQDRIRNLQHPQISIPSVPASTSSALPTPSISSSEGEVQAVAPTISVPTGGTLKSGGTSTIKSTAPRATPGKPTLVSPTPAFTSGVCSGPIMGPDVVTSTPTVVDPSLRRSTRAIKGTFQATKYIDEAYWTSIDRLVQSDSYTNNLAYLAEISTCCDTGLENVVDPRVYASKVPGSDPDMPTFHQAMNGEHAEQWVKQCN